MNWLFILLQLLLIISAAYNDNENDNDKKKGTILSMSVARGICNDNILFSGSNKLQPPSTSWAGITTVKPGRPCQAVKWNHWLHCGGRLDRSCSLSKFQLIPCTRKAPGWKSLGARGRNADVSSTKASEGSSSEKEGEGGKVRVVGGTAATSEQVPYIVGVYQGTKRICAGTIISPHYILSLTSCYRDTNSNLIDPKLLVFVAGDPRPKFNDRTEKVVSAQKSTASNDMILFEIFPPIPVSNAVQQAVLPEAHEVPSGSIIVSGWGTLDPKVDGDLHIGEGEIRPKADCKAHNETKDVLDTEICLFPGKDGSCESDKGGPIIQQQLDNTFTLVGILKTAHACGEAGIPGVGVRVSAFIPWILQNINPLQKQISSKVLPRPPAVAANKMAYAVRIVKDGKTLCGGGIVNEVAVVTAASCVYNETMANTILQIIAGDFNVNAAETTEQARSVFQIISHPHYDPVSYIHDIAMIVVVPPFKLDGTKVSPLFTLVPPENLLKPWTLSGWGSIAQNQSNAFNLQQQIPMKNISFQDCLQKYNRTVTKLEDNIICAIPNSNQELSTCRSDIGSSLVSESNPGFYTIFGVASFRLGCDDAVYPMVFTDAQKHQRFIDDLFKDAKASSVINQLELPFHVFVNSPSYIPCGGVILNERFVLTAAQCLQNIPAGEAYRVKVYGGKLSLHNKGQFEMRLGVRNAIIHEDFDSVSLAHDIALLELESPIPFNNEIQPGNLAQTSFSQSNIEQAIKIGYGVEQTTSRGELQRLKVNLMRTGACRNEYLAADSRLSIDNGKLCTISHVLGNCIGDPGAALYEYEVSGGICRNIIGILSHQSDCKTSLSGPYLPSVHTDVAFYRPWIQRHMEKVVFNDGQPSEGSRRSADEDEAVEGPGISQRAFGGSNAFFTEFPHQVQMVTGDEIVCSGAILDGLHVVTSATCATKMNLNSFMRAGTDVLGNPLQQRGVLNIKKHEEFDVISRVNDIAVVTAEAPWTFNVFVAPIAYSPTTHVLPGTVGVMSSWGFGFVDERFQPTTLQKITFQGASFGACVDIYGCGFLNIPGLICVQVSGNERAGICEGDQGGGLVVEMEGKKMLVGVASFRSGCMSRNYPSVFTSTSFHFTWIQNHLNLEPDVSVRPNEFPFLATVLYKFLPLCCCTILSETEVLIPSRCLVDGNKNLVSEWSVLAGNDGLTPNLQGQIRLITEIRFNTGLLPDNLNDDFAIAHTPFPFAFNTFIQNAIVPPPNYKNVNELIVNSWQLRPNYKLFQKLFASPVDNSFCQKPYEDEQNITGVLFCAVFSNPKYDTSPDLAGGPMSEKLENGCHVIIASPVATCFTDTVSRPCIFNNMVNHGNWMWDTMEELQGRLQDSAQRALQGQFPFLVRIIKGKDPKINSTLCAGVIISPKIVLSASSCFTDVNEEDVTVIGGEFDYTKVDNGEQMRPVTAILSHEDYNDITRANDIALLLLPSELPSTRFIKYAELATPETNILVPNTMTLAGFEHSRQYGGIAHNSLDLQTTDKCRLDYPCSRFPIGQKTRCGVTTGGFGSGFQGSPLFVNNPNDPSRPVFGLHTFRHGCSGGFCTRVFTDLVPYADWILNKPAGGMRVQENKYKFHVIIALPDGLHCSGSLIGPFHVLTTMSCVINYHNKIQEIRIIAGLIDYDVHSTATGIRQPRRLNKIYINANYTGDKTKINDICLLEVQVAFRPSPTVGFVLLPKAPSVAQGQVDITGWYFTEPAAVAHVREANMTVLDLPTCETGFEQDSSKVITDHMICTFFNAPSFCFGDTGSPMTQLNGTTCRTLIGISSQNFDCGNLRFPSIYTNVSSALDYIHSNVPKDKPLATDC